jgi:hypothetical protein
MPKQARLAEKFLQMIMIKLQTVQQQAILQMRQEITLNDDARAMCTFALQNFTQLRQAAKDRQHEMMAVYISRTTIRT